MQTGYSVQPAANLVLFYGLMIVARIELGRWPIALQDNPAFFGWAELVDLIILGSWVLTGVVAVGLAPVIAVRYAAGWPRTTLCVVLPWASWALVVLFVRLDPGGCINWLMD